MSQFGIDVSSYNGKIRWDKVKEAGCGYAVLKITQRNLSFDNRFRENWKGCAQQHIPCGVYRYVYEATPKQARRAAEMVVKLLDSVDAPEGTMVWWDMEDDSIEPVLAQERETLKESVLTARKVVEEAGYGFGIYCGLWWYRSIIGKMDIDCPYWIARYPTSRALPFGTAPAAKYRPEIKGQLWGWQYSSAGQVPGIDHRTDLDVIYGSITTPIVYAEPKENLRRGDRGDGVCWVQQRLNCHGAHLAVDGIFGPKTEEAVRAFQQKNGLAVDGIVGPNTRRKLR